MQGVVPADIIDGVHEHHIPMRWADIDSLDHVNNVVYLAYAAEGRAAMADAGLLPKDLVPETMTVRFVRPLRLGRRPVVVASTIQGQDVVQHVAVDDDSGRTVFAEVTTSTRGRTAASVREDVPTVPLSLRRDDLDAGGVATPTKIFELFQETRVLQLSTMLGAMRPGRFVVGTSAVTFRDDVRWRLEPLQASAWVGRVGRGSFDMRSQLSDGRAVLAESTTTLVGFDPVTQTSKPFDDDERAQLGGLALD
jgi:acyl-CoA thioester hydrolase